MPRAFSPHIYDELKDYSELPSSFETTSSVQQRSLISPSLYNFVIDEIMGNVSGDLRVMVGFKLANGEKLFNIDCADDLVWLVQCTEHAQLATDRIPMDLAPFNICFLPLKSKALLHDWTTVVVDFMLEEKELTIVGCFSFPGNCST